MNNELNKQEEKREETNMFKTQDISEEIKKLQQMREELLKNTKEMEENIPTFEEHTKEKQQEKGKQKTLGTYPKQRPNNYGFADKLLITLLVGFAGGVIATTLYIFINLGKFTFTI